jgi:hypothetical protein
MLEIALDSIPGSSDTDQFVAVDMFHYVLDVYFLATTTTVPPTTPILFYPAPSASASKYR